jgi:hypothetical protein
LLHSLRPFFLVDCNLGGSVIRLACGGFWAAFSVVFSFLFFSKKTFEQEVEARALKFVAGKRKGFVYTFSLYILKLRKWSQFQSF